MSMSIKPAEQYKQFRAPAENGQILCEPKWRSLISLVTANCQQRSGTTTELFGQPLSKLASHAQQALLQAALDYTQTYTETASLKPSTSPLIVTGHQPDLVHAGVWLKNFAAAQLAEQMGGTAINLIIDSDLCRSPSVSTPSGSVENPHVETIAYDQVTKEIPFEERLIRDQTLWQSFGKRVSQAIQPLVDEPLISQWWQKTVLQSDCQHIGNSIAQARHRLELQWGSRSLEIPQSRICQTTPFRLFANHLLVNAAKVHDAYNHALAEYRQAHRLRNHAQPVPDLAEMDGWIETPFWIWTTDNPQRRALFVQVKKESVELTNQKDLSLSLPITADSDPSQALQQMATWEGQGIKIRTRALVTTMYTRLFLADLFVHGIGGAKYDQVTDAFCHRLFGFSPPAYATLSGTLRLPIDHETYSAQSQSVCRKKLREMTYHPDTEIAELSLDDASASEIAELLKKKKIWVHTTKTPENASERHQSITSVNQALQPWLAPQRAILETELAQSEQRILANQLLESREYPFCLFSRETLCNFLLDFSSRML